MAARLAYLVTGGTGSGKTTLLGTLLGLVPPTERIVLTQGIRMNAGGGRLDRKRLDGLPGVRG